MISNNLSSAFSQGVNCIGYVLNFVCFLTVKEEQGQWNRREWQGRSIWKKRSKRDEQGPAQ